VSDWASLAGAAYALPLDIFRVLVGLLSLAYFARTFREAPLFSSPDGLLDHALQRRLLPFTRMGLFPPNAPLWLLRGAYASGCAAAVLLVLGIAVQPVALFLYLLAVSTYRWNLLLMYVDDTIIHLSLFWMVVLPIGRTLTLPELLTDPAGSWAAWQSAVVPGLGVRGFLANMALVYLVAGLWKWRSPMWRRGTALSAVLSMAIAYTPGFWRRLHPAWLRLGNYVALAIEPALALLVIVPPHAPLKWLLLGGVLVFHTGILVTMKFPFANLAMLGGTVVFFGPELMNALGAGSLEAAGLAAQAPPPRPGDWLAVATVTCLALLFLLNAVWFTAGATTTVGTPRRPRRGPAINPFYVPLWIIGLAQSYRLFDWIDERNYAVEYEVVEQRRGERPRLIDPEAFFPLSMRHVLLQSYLYGNLWIKLDPERLPDLRASILAGYARRHLDAHPAVDSVEVSATVRRLTGEDPALQEGTRTLLMSFTNRGGTPGLTRLCLTPPVYV
jgi:hypothetical protein